jgi:dTDP-4-dehydrorhamnose 3,5-epimerase
MTITETIIPGVILFEPKVFTDERGYFFESYSKRTLQEAGVDVDFVQDNQSMSHKNIVRGLHAQKGLLNKANWLGYCKVLFWMLLLMCAKVRQPTAGMYLLNLLPIIKNNYGYRPAACMVLLA